MNAASRTATRLPITERPRRLFMLIGGSTLLTSINYSLIFVAFTDMGKAFGVHTTIVSWALTGYSITAAALLVPAGWMADRFGRERMLVYGMACFVTGSALVAWSPNVWLLIAGRIVQALGMVCETSAALPILLDAFPNERRATIVGSFGAMGGVAATIGPVVGGALVGSIGWRWTFALNIPIGMVFLALIARYLPRPPLRPATSPPDLVGVGLLALGMGSVVLAITQIKVWGLDARTVGAFVGGIVALTFVVQRSRRHRDPVLFIPLFRDPSFRRGLILNVVIAGTFSGTFFAFIQLLTKGWGMSTFQAGASVAVIPLFGGPLSYVSGRIADRFGPKAVIVPGAFLIAIAGMIFATSVTSHRNVVGLFLPVAVIYGIGVGFAHAACYAAALRTVTSERLGVGGAMARIGMDTGAVITVAISVALVSTARDPVHGVRIVMMIVSIVCALGALYAWLRLDKDTTSHH